ncbi:uncharacterized protein [Fopius arisanus]|uniref:Uncharacterized protein isoform X2 n=1 Tax=Fopius arisanus TaxID=64838 RepID=A0A9R1TTB7_9HYME|nr:PREDICTED: uncharacterized protein LOC105274173 isoform X2 [Fopius arisanus]
MTVKLFLAIFAVILTGCGVSPRPINGPINEPIKISLDKPEEFLDNNIIRTASGWERSMEFTSEASNKVIAVIAAREAKKIIEDVEAKKSFGVSKKKGSIQGEKLELKTSGNDEPQKTVKRSTIESHSGSPVKTSPISDFFPPKTRENARLENEGGQSLFELPKKTSIQKLLLSMFTPTPLLDRTTEEEKYGNSGERFNDVGRALVNGFEALSNFINTVVDLPVNAAKKTSRGLTAALNQVGGKLIGLE